MTRQEKNQLKRKYNINMQIATVAVIMMISCMVLAFIVSNKGFETGRIFAIVAAISLITGIVTLFRSYDFEFRLNRYRSMIRSNRRKNLLKVGIEALGNKNFEKAFNIHNIIKGSDYGIFFKGYLLSSCKLSGDEKLIARADLNLNQLY